MDATAVSGLALLHRSPNDPCSPANPAQGPHPDHLFFVLDEALARSATFDVPVEVLVRADRFEIDKPHLIIEGVTEQVELSLTAEL